MLKQTVLKFQGALGLLGFGTKEGGKDGDSSATGFSDDDDEEGKREPVVGKHSRPVSTARTTYQPVAVADLEDAALQLLKRRRT